MSCEQWMDSNAVLCRRSPVLKYWVTGGIERMKVVQYMNVDTVINGQFLIGNDQTGCHNFLKLLYCLANVSVLCKPIQYSHIE